MLFRKKIQRDCTYCSNGTVLEDGSILCIKKGCLPENKPCRKFSYDPCKRIPPKRKALDFSQYNDRDYSL